MILSPMNVELTKVHYYESFRKHRNRDVTIPSWEVTDNNININLKRNIFGQKSWTFNVNDTKPQNLKSKHYLYKQIAIILTICIILALFASIIIAVIYLHNSPKQIRIVPQFSNNYTRLIVFDRSELNVEAVLERHRKRTQRLELDNNKTHEYKLTNKDLFNVCHCKTGEVCLRQKKGTPLCVIAKDVRDPSGCGGLCKLNTQHCRLLDKRLGVYECAENGGGLRCPLEYFNCANSLCIHESRLCDGVVDCVDFSDEKDCSCELETHFHCGKETSCFPKWRRCDGKVDCWDTSDEIGCPQRANCPSGQYSCRNTTQCFQEIQFCDGNYDCADKSDEICTQ